MEIPEFRRLVQNVGRLIHQGAEPGAPALRQMEKDLAIIGSKLHDAKSNIVYYSNVFAYLAQHAAMADLLVMTPHTAEVLLDIQTAPPVCVPAATTSTTDVLAESLAAPPIGSLAAGPSTRSVEPLAVALDDSEATTRPFKRPKISGFLDSAGQVVTPMRLHEATGSFLYVTLPMLCARYLEKFGHELFPDGSNQQDLYQALTTMEEFQSFHVRSVNSGTVASLNIIRRIGTRFSSMSRQFMSRLKLSKGFGSVVPGPLLFCRLAMLSCIPADELSFTALCTLFKLTTGQVLGSVQIVTSVGVKQQSNRNLYDMVKQWIRDLSLFIVKGGQIDNTLNMAANCNKTYAARCLLKGDTYTVRDINLDPKGAIAMEMLREDVHHSQLFLGIQALEIGALVGYLPLIMSRTDSVLAERLTEVVNSHLASS